MFETWRAKCVEYRLEQAIKVPRGFEAFQFTSPFTTRNGPLFVKCGKAKAVFGFRADHRHLAWCHEIACAFITGPDLDRTLGDLHGRAAAIDTIVNRDRAEKIRQRKYGTLNFEFRRL